MPVWFEVLRNVIYAVCLLGVVYMLFDTIRTWRHRNDQDEQLIASLDDLSKAQAGLVTTLSNFADTLDHTNELVGDLADVLEEEYRDCYSDDTPTNGGQQNV